MLSKRILTFLLFSILLVNCKKQDIENTISIKPNEVNSAANESSLKVKKIKTKLTKKIRKNNTSNNNRVEPNTDCIDWYWTVYDAETGEIYSETFLYTTCGDETGGGGGGGNVNAGKQCVQNAIDNFNQQHESMESTSEDMGFESGDLGNVGGELTKYKNPKWSPLNGLLYKLNSQESGVVKYNSTDGWRWKSLTHNNIYVTGIDATLFWKISFNNDFGTPSFTPETAEFTNIYSASMNLSFIVKETPFFSECTFWGITISSSATTINTPKNQTSPRWNAIP